MPLATIYGPATEVARRYYRQFRRKSLADLLLRHSRAVFLVASRFFVNTSRRIFFSRLPCFVTTCGEKGIRTPDPLLAKQVLYQLSYFPDP